MIPIFVVVLLVTPGALASLSTATTTECPPECPEVCPSVQGCAETKLDDCGCCSLCLRAANETCGPEVGVCSEGLFCKFVSSNDLVGKCTARWPEPCLKAKCDVVFPPKCPEDSRLEVPRSDDECCPKKGKCVCDADKCRGTTDVCPRGYERVLLVEGTGFPGSCCDKYECRKLAKDCAHVVCEDFEDTVLHSDCPADSFRPLSYVPEGACCPIQPDCRCKPGFCQPVQCAKGLHPVIVKKGDGRPSHCCDHFKCVSAEENSIEGAIARRTLRCFDRQNNQTYIEGDTFLRSPCDTCECHSGIIKCKQMQCPNIGKGKCFVGHKKDECCPVCIGCLDDDGDKRVPGENWRKNECTNCTCNTNFTATCTMPICKTDCKNPRKVEGECCPVCDAPTVIEPPVICPSLAHCPLRCEHGLHKTAWGCFECKCAEAIEPALAAEEGSNCEDLSESNCDKQCAHGYRRDQKGCPVCKCAKCPPIDTCYKHCLYGFETNSLGCPVCKCRPRSKIDARLQITEPERTDTCFSVVEGDVVVERDSGEWWTDGHCRQCFCQHRIEFCSLISCPPRPKDCAVDLWRTAKGECCPSCRRPELANSSASGGDGDADGDVHGDSAKAALAKHGQTVCHSPGDGRLYVDGETWNLADCVSCTCRMGHVLCTATQCPPVPCETPLKTDDDECCPRCSDSEAANATAKTAGFCTDDRGIARPIGDTWRLDDCTSCRCVSDEEKPLCFTEKCADAEDDCQGRPLMIKGRCCPVCSDSLQNLETASCSFRNQSFTVNEEFRASACRNCTCRVGGLLECVELQCAPCMWPSAPVPHLAEQQCCPVCEDRSVSSSATGNEYREGDEVVSPPLEAVPGHPFDDVVLVLFLAFAIFGLLSAVLGIVFMVVRRRRNVSLEATTVHGRRGWLLQYVPQQLKARQALTPPKLKDPCVGKVRNTSESESANMSLLSSHSDSSTAPSTNCPSDHSETTPLTAQQSRLDLV